MSSLTRRGLLGGLLASSGMAAAQSWRPGRAGFGAGFQLLSVSAANPGATATAFPIPPTLQYHVVQSTLTMRAPANLTGYISGTTLTVSANDGPPIVIGDPIIVPGGTACTIVKVGTGSNSSVYGANTGTFTVSVSQTVGSSGSPIVMTCDAKWVTKITDLRGTGYDLSNADAATGGQNPPRLMTDGYGRKFLRFIAPISYLGSWLRNTSYPTVDNGNSTVIFIGRMHQPNGLTSTIVSNGCYENGGTTTSNYQICQVYGGFAAKAAVGGSYTQPLNPANVSQLLVGTQMSLLGGCTATTDGVGGGTGSSNVTNVFMNEQTYAGTSGISRSTKQGFEVGHLSSNNPASGGTTAWSFMDLYELNLWFGTEMGTNTSTAMTRASAQRTAALNNWNIVPITKRVVIGGDSRSVNGTGFGGSGDNIQMLLTEPGRAWSLPANVSVVGVAVTGMGIGNLASYTGEQSVNGSSFNSPINAQMMLKSAGDTAATIAANNIFAMFMGTNDRSGAKWPTTTGGTGGASWANGTYAAGSAAMADEMYNNSPYSASFNATVAASANSLVLQSFTVANPSGKMYPGSQISLTGISPGAAVSPTATPASASPLGLNIYQGSTGVTTSTAGSLKLRSYQEVVQQILTLGFSVRWLTETAQAGGNASDPSYAELNSKVMNNAVADASAALGYDTSSVFKVRDMASLTVNGVKVLGTGAVGTQNDPLYVDGVHNTRAGMVVMASGGDTPQLGYSFAVQN